MEVWLLEAAKGIGRMFLNPLLYWIGLLALLVSINRIKKERYNFGTKVFDAFTEWKHNWVMGMVSGLLISGLTLGVGIVFPYPVIILLSLVMIVFSLSTGLTWFSAAYTFGFSYFILLFLPSVIGDYFPVWAQEIQAMDFTGFTLIMGVFLLVEGLLFFRINRNETFPELLKGSRGKWVGQHRLKKLVFIPFFTLVPAGAIEPFIEWWPFFSIGGESYGLILLPFLTGFEHVTKGKLPLHSAKAIGKSVIVLGFLTIVLACASVYVSSSALAAAAVALIGREFISFKHRNNDKKRKSFFSPEQDGLLILGLIPGTPADRLGLLIGEKVVKVNGRKVFHEQEFYEALQLNSAYCKLEVRDDNGEIRFTQRAMYQGDHHELGLVFAKEQYREKKRISG